MRFETLLGVLPGVLATLPFLTSAPASNAAHNVDLALRRGGACVAGAARDDFANDPYVSYLYPQEALPSPDTAHRTTYRLIDVQFVLVQLGQIGHAPEALEEPIREANLNLRAVLPLLNQRGFSNTRRNAQQNGVALDTLCMLGWLFHNRSTAELAQAALGPDGWLIPGLYTNQERFRALADESWCLRLLAAQDLESVESRAAFERSKAIAAQERQTDPAGRATFYDAWHLAMLPQAQADHALAGELRETFRAWAEAHHDLTHPSADLVEWANLATLGLMHQPESRPQLERAIAVLLDTQGDDGCWRVPGAKPAERGTVFVSLRALLALALYRETTLGTVAGESPGP